MIGSFESQNGMAHMRYFHRDNLGSIAVITDNAASVVERLSYDAWGKRRQLNGSDDSSSNSIKGIVTHRGFTGQEHLENQGLVHMNGRVQDPWLGIFLSPDPVIGSPDNPQNYNRYGYVQNNPLTLTDPSGFTAESKDESAAIDAAVAQLDQKGAGASQSGSTSVHQQSFATTTGDSASILTGSTSEYGAGGLGESYQLAFWALPTPPAPIVEGGAIGGGNIGVPGKRAENDSLGGKATYGGKGRPSGKPITPAFLVEHKGTPARTCKISR